LAFGAWRLAFGNILTMAIIGMALAEELHSSRSPEVKSGLDLFDGRTTITVLQILHKPS